MEQNLKRINKELTAACEDLIQCLEGWLEIADPEDLRVYDEDALFRGRQAVALSKTFYHLKTG